MRLPEMRRARRRGMIEISWESVQEEVADACGSEVGGTRAHAARSSQAPPWSAAIVLLGTGAPGPRLRCRTGSLKPGWLHSRAAGQGGGGPHAGAGLRGGAIVCAYHPKQP